MYRALREDAERLADQVVSFTRELIRTPSPSLHEEKVAAKVRDCMRDLDFDLVFIDDAGNVVGMVAGGDPSQTLLLLSHMDTSRVGPLDEWSHPPLGAETSGGRVFGLGAADGKAAIASQVFASHIVSRRLAPPRTNLLVVATVAEEGGCSVGTRFLAHSTLPRIGVEPRFCVLGEPTGLDVGIGHDGFARIDFDVRAPGREAAACAAEIVSRELRQHCETGGVGHGRPVMTASPARSEASADGWRSRVQVLRRVFPGEAVADILRCLECHVSSELCGLRSVDLQVHVHHEEQVLYTGRQATVTIAAAPWSTSLTHPLVDGARESLLAAGLPWNPRMWAVDRLGMATAGSVLAVDFGVPSICFGPGDESEVGAPDESVAMSEVALAVSGFAALAYGLGQVERAH